MKQVFTVLFAVSVLGLVACKTNPKEALMRRWKVVDAAGPMLTSIVKAQYIGEENMLEFKSDGSYIAWSKGKEDDSGTYTLSEDGKTLTTKTGGNGPGQTMMMKELTKDKMIITMGTLDITFEPFK